MDISFVLNDILERDVKIIAPDLAELSIKGAQFKYMEMEDYNKLVRDKGDDAMAVILVGWESFIDAKSATFDYNEQTRDELLSRIWVLKPLFKKYLQAIQGEDQGNLTALRELGRRAREAEAQKADQQTSR